MIRVIQAKDYLGKEAMYAICFETIILHETFAVGIDTQDRGEVSIFHVVNDGRKDNYECLDTCFWDIYLKYNLSFEKKFKKEITQVLKRVLRNRVEAGLITVEQIQKWVKNA